MVKYPSTKRLEIFCSYSMSPLSVPSFIIAHALIFLNPTMSFHYRISSPLLLIRLHPMELVHSLAHEVFSFA